MKKYEDLHILFEKAASESAQISFDETKTAFVASAPPMAASVKGKSFFAKKWILMISTVITASLVAGFLLTQPSKNDSKAEHSHPVVMKKENDSQPQIQEETSSVEHVPAKEVFGIEKEAPNYLKPRSLQISPSAGLQPAFARSLQSFKPKRDAPRKQPYRFPQLTEDEIKQNNKRIKNMVRDFAKRDKNSYAFIPSASIYIDTQEVSIQAFVIQKYEVSNIEYKTFLFDLLIQGKKDDFLKAKPEQIKWVEHYGKGMQVMTDTYFSEEAYDEYPVVNVSRKGAEMYCNWLTKQVHAYTEKRDQPYYNDIRLPQREEWIYAAGAGDTSMIYPIAPDSLTNENGCYLANFHPEGEDLSADGGFHTVAVSSYNPNEFGLYCVAGNAAEMVNDGMGENQKSGTAGGSWENGAESLEILGADPYSEIEEGHPAIGFRVVTTYLGREN